jgi:hypothetical protein
MNTSLDLYRRLIIAAHFRQMHQACKARACRKGGRCTGGPRGTFSRLGVPACLAGELAAHGGDVTRLIEAAAGEDSAAGQAMAACPNSGSRYGSHVIHPAERLSCAF